MRHIRYASRRHGSRVALSAALALALGSATAVYAQTPQPAGVWAFDEGASTSSADSAGNKTGTLMARLA